MAVTIYNGKKISQIVYNGKNISTLYYNDKLVFKKHKGKKVDYMYFALTNGGKDTIVSVPAILNDTVYYRDGACFGKSYIEPNGIFSPKWFIDNYDSIARNAIFRFYMSNRDYVQVMFNAAVPNTKSDFQVPVTISLYKYNSSRNTWTRVYYAPSTSTSGITIGHWSYINADYPERYMGFCFDKNPYNNYYIVWGVTMFTEPSMRYTHNDPPYPPIMWERAASPNSSTSYSSPYPIYTDDPKNNPTDFFYGAYIKPPFDPYLPTPFESLALSVDSEISDNIKYKQISYFTLTATDKMYVEVVKDMPYIELRILKSNDLFATTYNIYYPAKFKLNNINRQSWRKQLDDDAYKYISNDANTDKNWSAVAKVKELDIYSAQITITFVYAQYSYYDTKFRIDELDPNDVKAYIPNGFDMSTISDHAVITMADTPGPFPVDGYERAYDFFMKK